MRIASATLLRLAIGVTMAVLNAGCVEPSPNCEPLRPRERTEREEPSNEHAIVAPEATEQGGIGLEMPAAVATSASTCHGHRIGAELEPARLISAERHDDRWAVELEGLWTFHMPLRPLPPGYPTREPWMDTHLAVWCKLVIDSRTGDLESMGARAVTATPPGVQEQ